MFTEMVTDQTYDPFIEGCYINNRYSSPGPPIGIDEPYTQNYTVRVMDTLYYSDQSLSN